MHPCYAGHTYRRGRKRVLSEGLDVFLHWLIFLVARPSTHGAPTSITRRLSPSYFHLTPPASHNMGGVERNCSRALSHASHPYCYLLSRVGG
ncbi:hypothetical protein B0T17DRAFT_516567 [Bombardia bombarda]|uniref:Uncharacterized protein n=1 Tax=Bombardia bombarda TaxID=252184 RepID=A0AA39XM48_9PEZI|nr:hypothetical protein B0T17DRAFT_516567 [Bombardia bombarda]